MPRRQVRSITEVEWRAATDCDPLLKVIMPTATDRKLRLFACACCRRIWELLVDPRCRRAVELSEQVADGVAHARQLRTASQAAKRAWLKIRTVWDRSSTLFQGDAAVHAATTPVFYGSIAAHELAAARPREFVARSVAYAVMAAENMVDCPGDAGVRERSSQCALLRDLFGNPFRPVAFSPAWRTDTVVALAAQMYESRGFGAMPILADALQDAGCDNDDILSHCRDASVSHVRGCWVIDLVLVGKQ